MKRHYVLLACLPVLMLSSCMDHVIVGHGPAKNETRQLHTSSFSRVEISAPVDARITVGGSPSLSFEGYANVIPYLRTEVRDNTLRIYTDEIASIDVQRNIIAHISLPTLEGLELSGSSDAVVTGPINTTNFDLDLSGAGNVDIQELHVRTFDGDMSGAASLLLRSGDIAEGSFGLSGSGDIKAFGVNQQNTSLELSGAAGAEVTVASKLDVDISGAGSVAYKGHPSISQDISGAGSVRDAN